jgi:8-oxo-dGTP pyrophosphatase MutT (NUDIX family)
MTEPTHPRSPAAAYAARQATDAPNVFLIPSEHLPAGFADKVEHGGWTAVEPRPAATVVLLRDGDAGPEALLLRRHGRSGFAAGAWVFPGGMVDADDAGPAVAEAMDGPTADEWARRLELDDASVALAFVASAVREAFEETGILLAHVRAGMDEERLDGLRRSLLAGEMGLGEMARDEGLRLAGGDLLYIAHWITPEPEPRRYDTRFFLATVPGDAVCTPHAAEMTDARWMAPADAVAAFERGEMKLLPPTVHTLRRLAGFASVAAVRAALADAPVPAILPVMHRRANGVAIEFPADV